MFHYSDFLLCHQYRSTQLIRKRGQRCGYDRESYVFSFLQYHVIFFLNYIFLTVKIFTDDKFCKY